VLLWWSLAGCAAGHEPAPIDAAPDVGVTCHWSARPAFVSFCNTAGEHPCDDWAASLSTDAPAQARCAMTGVDAGDTPRYRCASADRCAAGTCYCGSDPECADGAACLRIETRSVCVPCSM
jgi:hypothetical protein